ncbi:hypothetical protein [Streptomyces sp. NPDC005336]|uniref:hypothetical protein n=1 Tax=Streptomyces sp. NPDC005336 TaxID=3157035 RepID=UPI00339ED472
MRTTRRVASAVLIVAMAGLVIAASSSVAQERPRHREAACSTRVRGSHATASCFNPYPRADRVQLHVECARWWDPDMDTRPVEVGPAQHVQLAERCWKEIRKAWVSHR